MLVVDTCIVIDVADDDPTFGRASAVCLAAHLEAGLLLSPVSWVELAPAFDGSMRRLDEFLAGTGIRCAESFPRADRQAAFRAWARHVGARRAGRAPHRPVADALIGALALRHDGIVTRNPADFRRLYPAVRVVEP